MKENGIVSPSVMSASLWSYGLYPPGSSVPGISQARMLKWVAMLSFRGSSWPRNQTQVSCIAGRFFSTSHQGSPLGASVSIGLLFWTHHINGTQYIQYMVFCSWLLSFSMFWSSSDIMYQYFIPFYCWKHSVEWICQCNYCWKHSVEWIRRCVTLFILHL